MFPYLMSRNGTGIKSMDLERTEKVELWGVGVEEIGVGELVMKER